MCKPHHPPLGRRVQLQIAKLMQMHKDTHPTQVAAHYGVTGQWIRRLWNRFTPEEIRGISEEEALGVLAQIRHGETESGNTQRTAIDVIRAARAAIPDRGSEPCPQCALAGLPARNR